ncbi:MFS transporter [Streptomyces tateyamensis]|uniref:MFS transporter n=1 Tax=Streptomyces tateyamensis TaxID=565073 RepID=A0A2V4P038_9ACTN|nr:MFS transporter [Streptomyces tateyamensis]
MLFTVGALPAYLAPTIVGRLVGELRLTATQAGTVGSVMLLASAMAGIALAGRVDRLGTARLARAGLVLLLAGFTLAGTVPGHPGSSDSMPLLLPACLLGGLGAGTCAAVAGTGIAAAGRHRITVLALLATSGTAGALYLLLPHLGPSHALPFLALALTGALTFPLLLRLPAGRTTAVPDPAATAPASATTVPASPIATAPTGPPLLGPVLAAGMVLWSVAQNALWGVSGQLGLHRAGLNEQRLCLVLAVALGSAVLGVLAAGLLGDRAGRAAPITLGTVAIAACVVLSATATSPRAFAVGEVLWNALYPLVLSYLIGTAAALDPSGRWMVLTGAAAALGVAGGPLTGAALLAGLGAPWFAALLGVVLLATAAPLGLVARTVDRRTLAEPTGPDPSAIPAQRAEDRAATRTTRAP